MIRVLGKGLTAQAIKQKYDNVILYDDSDFDTYDKKSDEITVVSPGIPPNNKMVKESNNQEQEIEQERVAWSAIAGAEHPGGPRHLALQVG